MAEDDERDLLRRLARLQLELWPVLSDPGYRAPLIDESSILEDPAYYFTAGDVIGYPINKGPERGRWKIDEFASPVIYLYRSLPDDDCALSSAYFWAGTETSGDNSRTAGKPLPLAKPERE